MLGKLFYDVMLGIGHITRHFSAAIILFTLFSKIILFPISLMSQKNSIVMVKMMPMLDDLKARYHDEPSQLLKEQKALYRKEKYSTIKAILPLLLQIPIIVGMVQAVNLAVNDIASFNFQMFGLDLTEVPTLFSPTVVIPIAAVVSSILLCWVQNVYNVASREQSFFAQWGTTIFLAAFSGYFAFACAAGVGLYWTVSNLMAIVVQYLCNVTYNPKKYIDYSTRTAAVKPTKEEKQAQKARKQAAKEKERLDGKRFYEVQDKKICFYSEASGFYKYYRSVIQYLLENSEIDLHYVTNDPDDQVFSLSHPRFHAYYCSPYGFITMAMKMDAAIVVMTTPDLESYQLKRSLVKKDIEYIYMDHGLTSFHLCLREGALDHFDTVFCYGPTHQAELCAMERMKQLPEKNKISVGFPLLADLIANYQAIQQVPHEVPQILIAPSWQKDNICELCLFPLLDALSGNGYHIILRPHPEFIKRFAARMRVIAERLQQYADVELQTNFAASATVYESDLLITDWSSIGLEFSLTTQKPSLFINTPMKVMNPNYEKLDICPLEIRSREQVGVSFAPDKMDEIAAVVAEMLANPQKFQSRIASFIEEELYPFETGAAIAGQYLIDRVQALDNIEK